MIRAAAAVLIACALAGCQTPRGARAFAGDVDALGTEPFWNVKLRGERMVLSRPERADIVIAQSSHAVALDRATWTAAGGGVALSLTLKRETCSDGMSDRVWPMSAEVRLGSETLKGCATNGALRNSSDSPQ